VLLRDAGDSLPRAPPFPERFGFTLASVVEMVVERGIARALGIADVDPGVDVEESTVEERLEAEARAALDALREYDGVYVHLKGPDEPGHDGDFEAKKRAIEAIDEYFMSRVLDALDPEKTLIVVTSDHATPWDLKAHSSDPVPLMVSHPALPEGPHAFKRKHAPAAASG